MNTACKMPKQCVRQVSTGSQEVFDFNKNTQAYHGVFDVQVDLSLWLIMVILDSFYTYHDNTFYAKLHHRSVFHKGRQCHCCGSWQGSHQVSSGSSKSHLSPRVDRVSMGLHQLSQKSSRCCQFILPKTSTWPSCLSCCLKCAYSHKTYISVPINSSSINNGMSL